MNLREYGLKHGGTTADFRPYTLPVSADKLVSWANGKIAQIAVNSSEILTVGGVDNVRRGVITISRVEFILDEIRNLVVFTNTASFTYNGWSYSVKLV